MVLTYKEKYNKKYGYPPGTSHSIEDISKTTGFEKEGLETIYRKGMGAYYTNPQSVRPSVKSPQQWSYGRIYSAILGGKAQKIDKSHLIQKDMLRVRFGKK